MGHTAATAEENLRAEASPRLPFLRTERALVAQAADEQPAARRCQAVAERRKWPPYSPRAGIAP